MNTGMLTWFLTIFAGLAVIAWLAVLIIQLLSQDRPELYPRIARRIGLSLDQVLKLKKVLLVYFLVCFAMSLLIAIFGFQNNSREDIGDIFFLSAAIIFLTAVYLAAIYFISVFMAKALSK